MMHVGDARHGTNHGAAVYLFFDVSFVHSAVVESQAVSQTRCLRLLCATGSAQQSECFLAPLQVEQSSSVAYTIQSVQTDLQNWATCQAGISQDLPKQSAQHNSALPGILQLSSVQIAPSYALSNCRSSGHYCGGGSPQLWQGASLIRSPSEGFACFTSLLTVSRATVRNLIPTARLDVDHEASKW